MAAAEIIELHHDRKLDAPSGTAALTAALMAAGERPPGAADPLGPPARARRPPGGDPRRPRPDADDPPRLDRSRVVHARRAAGRRRVGAFDRSPVIGLEHLLFERLSEGIARGGPYARAGPSRRPP